MLTVPWGSSSLYTDEETDSTQITKYGSSSIVKSARKRHTGNVREAGGMMVKKPGWSWAAQG